MRFIFNTSQAKISRCLPVSAVTTDLPTLHIESVQNNSQYMCVCVSLHGEPTFHGDVLDGKTEDDGPNHTQSHLQVPINNFCGEKEEREEGGRGAGGMDIFTVRRVLVVSTAGH